MASAIVVVIVSSVCDLGTDADSIPTEGQACENEKRHPSSLVEDTLLLLKNMPLLISRRFRDIPKAIYLEGGFHWQYP